jgi:hypothetical protein
MIPGGPHEIEDEEIPAPTPFLIETMAAYKRAIAEGRLVVKDPLTDALRMASLATARAQALEDALRALDPDNPTLVAPSDAPEPKVIGYQVIEVTTGEPTRGETEILSQSAAIRELLPLRESHGPDLFVIATILEGDLDWMVGEAGPVRLVE